MFKKKVSVLTLAIAVIVVGASAFGVAVFSKKEKRQEINIPSGPKCPETMDQIRLKQYQYTHPLVLSDIAGESEILLPIRSKVESYINQVKQNNQATEVSVYFRRLNDGAWFCINPNQSYNPASMSKVLYVLVYLKEAEQDLSILNKKIFFAKHFASGNTPNIGDFRLPENRYYAVRELLGYLIKYSDNDAALLLSQHMNQKIYFQLFKDLNIPTPDLNVEYYITPTDFSKFFRVLYNASYIRPELSEVGLKLLITSTFSEGLRKGIDPSIPLAHKFGERIIGNKAQLHEFGVVFIENDPYLIGVMSSGSNLQQLTNIVAEISRLVFDDYSRLYKSS